MAIYIYPNIGCWMTLKHQEQRKCHQNKCTKPTPPEEVQIEQTQTKNIGNAQKILKYMVTKILANELKTIK